MSSSHFLGELTSVELCSNSELYCTIEDSFLYRFSVILCSNVCRFLLSTFFYPIHTSGHFAEARSPAPSILHLTHIWSFCSSKVPAPSILQTTYIWSFSSKALAPSILHLTHIWSFSSKAPAPSILHPTHFWSFGRSKVPRSLYPTVHLTHIWSFCSIKAPPPLSYIQPTSGHLAVRPPLLLPYI
jgi:hypothetical protein